ncbi:MAG: TonB-dependent receptor, partial [Desulfobacteraceae bacterium]|nr:TonB-dependent receptor [Desulfobacteraceae bacterium]
MKKWISVLVPLALLAFPNSSLAEKENSQSLTTLEEVVVTATKTEERRKDIPNSVILIDEIDIEESSAKSLGELLA